MVSTAARPSRVKKLAGISGLKNHLWRIFDVLQYKSEHSSPNLNSSLIILDLVTSVQENQRSEFAFIIKQQKSPIFIFQQSMYPTDRNITDSQVTLVAPPKSDRFMVSRHNQTQCRGLFLIHAESLQNDIRASWLLNRNQLMECVLMFDKPRQCLFTDLTFKFFPLVPRVN